MTSNEYPTVRLTKINEGYATRDGKYRIVRDTFSDIGSSNAGCYKACWHVFRGDVRIAKFIETLAEARTEIACDIELWFGGDLCRHGIDN